METYGRFLFEFLDQFFSGFKDIFGGFFSGFQKIFNIGRYKEIVQYYKNDFSMPEWVLVAIAIGTLILLAAIVALLIFLFIIPTSFFICNWELNKVAPEK